MIQEITLKNFKAFQNLVLPCKNLNILTGLNGMGKSSVIQALLVLRQSYFDKLLNDKKPKINLNSDYVDVGFFSDVMYGLYSKKEAYMNIEIKFQQNGIASWKTTENYVDAKDYNKLAVSASNVSEKTFENSIFSVSKFHYIKAERLGPRDAFEIDLTKTDEKDFGTNGYYAFQYYWKNFENKINIQELAHEKEKSLFLKSQMQAWLSEISPNINIHAKESKGILYPAFSFGIKGQEHKPKNVGFGISYTFSVILALLTAEKGDLIIIENPEAHLHPKGQSKITELMALAAQNGVQIFCETHSDHIINGALVAVYQHSKNKNVGISNENINISFFSRNKISQLTENTSINISEKGRIKNAPDDFFDQIDIDLRRMI